MEIKEFKKIFGEIAVENGFSEAFGGWYKESLECIAVLELQKSNFSNSFYLNIKIFIQNAFGSQYLLNKDLIESSTGHIMQQIRDEDFFDANAVSEDVLKEKLKNLFSNRITPFANNALSKNGIRELADKKQITLLPAVELELNK